MVDAGRKEEEGSLQQVFVLCFSCRALRKRRPFFVLSTSPLIYLLPALAE